MSGWQTVENAPIEVTVIAWGKGGLRFMRKDKLGQWRNMMGLPKQSPTHWIMPPEPPKK